MSAFQYEDGTRFTAEELEAERLRSEEEAEWEAGAAARHEIYEAEQTAVREARSKTAAEVLRQTAESQARQANDPFRAIQGEIHRAEQAGDSTAARQLKNQYASMLMRAQLGQTATASPGPRTLPTTTGPCWVPVSGAGR